MKKHFLFYKNFNGELCVVSVEKLPLLKRIIYRKKFDIKFHSSYKAGLFYRRTVAAH